MLKKQIRKPHRRMYILVRKRVPPGIAAVNAAHAALVCYERYKNRDKETRRWFESGRFYKVLVAVTDAEFKKAKRVPGNVVIREDQYHNAEIAMAFRPRRDWPKEFLEFPFFPAKIKRKRRRLEPVRTSGRTAELCDSPAYGM